jgi:hypothetical protein
VEEVVAPEVVELVVGLPILIEHPLKKAKTNNKSVNFDFFI